jgi:hypothetical protein
MVLFAKILIFKGFFSTFRYEDDDYCVHESMTINGDKSLSVHPLYDCPEDAIIGRDLVSCTDVIESYTISVKLGAVASTDLNETFTRNTAGNSLIWDKMNSVPVAADPNVISMSSSNTAILTNTYTESQEETKLGIELMKMVNSRG